MRLNRFFASLRFRMAAVYISIIILAFVAVGSIVFGLVERVVVSQRTEIQEDDVARLALEIGPLLHSGDTEALFALLSERAQMLDARVLVLDVNAVVQADTASLYNGYRLGYREVRQVLVNRATLALGFHRLPMRNERSGKLQWVVYYTAPITVEGELCGVALMSASIQDALESVSNITGRIAIVLSVFAAVAGLVSVLAANWVTRPAVTLTKAIQRVGSQGYSERVPVHGRGELAALSEAFNVMSDQLEKHDRLRNEFVSNASHELKTPLSTMKLLAETLLYQETQDPAMVREFLTDINHEVDRLTNIVNDLLLLVQEERSELELTYVTFRLDEMAARVVHRLNPLAKNKELKIVPHLSPVVLEADESRLERVATNLIDNAIKYTDRGSIQVTVRQEGGQAVLIVRDSGIGIPKEALPRLFERFYRVDKARSRSTGGTGLGLSIVERIVAMHDGYIQADSTLGEGTTFTVRLPLNRKAAEKQRAGKENA